jgi:hypothetical protein
MYGCGKFGGGTKFQFERTIFIVLLPLHDDICVLDVLSSHLSPLTSHLLRDVNPYVRNLAPLPMKGDP